MTDPLWFDESASSGRLLAEHGPGDNAAPLSISEISNVLKRVVEDRFGHVRVRGELSGVKRAASGHIYCSLKDENAVIDGVMWRSAAPRLAFKPEDGIEVIATGKITTFAGRSKYQIIIESMEIAGEGALLALLEKTRLRLAAEGLFAPERKRPLPYLPKVIGVVTSPTGAVIRDILHRLADRFPSHVIVWPVPVQGDGAAQKIAQAIDGFSALPADGAIPRPDLLIVARGGGSVEDLWAFNEEVVVRAIAACSIPTISAVGHETDTSLADFAADLRAPTPTAAAEIAVPVREDLIAQLGELALRKRRCALQPVSLGRERLTARVQRLPRPETLLATSAQRLDDLSERLRRGLSDRAAAEREKLGALTRHLSLPVLRQKQMGAVRELAHAHERLQGGLRLMAAGGQARLDKMAAGLRPHTLRLRVRDDQRRLDATGLSPAMLDRKLRSDRERLSAYGRVLPQLNPKMPLMRGFVRVTNAEGHTLTNRAEAAKEQALLLEFHDGELAVGVGGRPPAKSRPASRNERQDEQGDLF